VDSKKLLRTITVEPTASIKRAAQIIQDSEVKIVLVVNECYRLVGTVTDGDIRRAVLHDIDLNGPVETIMNRHPKVSHRNDNLPALRVFMRDSVIRHLPHVDEEGRLVDLIVLDDKEDVERQNAVVVLMAGGRGSRLMPLTEHTPKPLLKIGSKPLLERQIEHLAAQGFQKYYISLNYLGHMIEDYFGDGSRFSVEISYLREMQPLGTAGALSLLGKCDQPLLVMNGDIITKTNFAAMLTFFRTERVAATMGVREFLYTVPYGCVNIHGSLIANVEEKPTMRHLINAGIYVLSPDALSLLRPDEHCDMPRLFHALIERGGAANTYHITEEWIDVGREEDLRWAQRLFEIGD
jgi:dTDP-glucose pyrophosphorylase